MNRPTCPLMLLSIVLPLSSTVFSAPAAKPKLDVSSDDTAVTSRLLLWYRQPAEKWVEALPIGNGRLGAMIFGGITDERLQLNEDTVWGGRPYDPANPLGLEAIRKGRQLVFDGKPAEAAKLLFQNDMGVPPRQMPYQPLGDLLLNIPLESKQITNYRRSLDLDTAIARTSYTAGGIAYTREVFSSAADQVICLRLTADKPGSINLTATMTTPLTQPKLESADGVLIQSGVSGEHMGIPGEVKTNTRLIAQNDGGSVTFDNNALAVRGANSVTLLLSAGTSYVNWNDNTGDAAAVASKPLILAAKKTYSQLRADHIANYQTLFHRVSLDVGTGEGAAQPTDLRIRNFAGGKDPGLAALLFQFGRYLLISCSRPGSQPANLQGLWNDSMSPPWESKFTININTEMNYWPAESTNLPECHLPLMQMIEQLPESGRRTAKVMYGAHGWVVHHNTDGWRATAPVDKNGAGIWPMGGAWLCTHLWEHYQFTGDLDFLRGAYPAMKGACEFFLDTLVEHPKYHWLVTCPSYSPEHGEVCAGPTMDMSILRDLFAQTAKASELLNLDPEFRAKILETRAKLAPFQIGHWGQLQEWLEDKDSEKDTHRHASHLYPLFPSNQITEKTPDLFKAARTSLVARGDAGTGWSLAWKVNLWARLLDGDHAYLILSHQLAVPGSHGHSFESAGGTFPNMFDAHPPFQIDGNFGATSGIAEMLLQSQNGEIHLLPALPAAWPNGSVTGLRARGGFEVDITWKNKSLATAAIRSVWGTACKVRYKEKTVDLSLAPGKSCQFDGGLKAR